MNFIPIIFNVSIGFNYIRSPGAVVTNQVCRHLRDTWTFYKMKSDSTGSVQSRSTPSPLSTVSLSWG